MSALPVLFVGGLTAGVAFVMSALFETSVLGAGVSWARKVRPSTAMSTGRAMKRASDFMRPMLTDVKGRAKTISGRCACRVARMDRALHLDHSAAGRQFRLLVSAT